MPFATGLTVAAVFTGKTAIRWEGRPASAIGKERVPGRVWLTRTGLDGDEQADLTVHGGLEKALHHYAADHYPFWKGEMPDAAEKLEPGGFGENISSTGLTEQMLCIGDQIRIGGAIVEISQGRQPCWKLSAHIGREDMAARFQKSGLTGWYYRVVEEGFIETGDAIALVARPQPDWPLDQVIAARFNPRLDPEQARALSEVAELSASWRDGFARKSNPAYAEDTQARLEGRRNDTSR